MRQNAWKLTLLSGLLLVAGAACTDRSDAGAPSARVTAAPEVTPAVVQEPLTYTVVAGDFLSEIAKEFEVTLEELIEVNDIENAALIEVGQVLLIPGAQTTAVDLFAAVAPAERWPDLYPPQELPPPPPLSPLDELRNRIAAWPWPPRETMVTGIVIGGFAFAALIVGLTMTPVEQQTRRWATRAAPRNARRVFHWWGNAAVVPRHSYAAVRRRAIAGWRLTVIGARITWSGIKAADQRYRRARTAVIMGWVRTKVHRERIAERAKPVLERADDIAGRAVDVTLERSRDIIETVRDRAPAAADTFSDRAISVRRSVSTGAQRARRDVFETAPAPERWRTRIAGELARAFERDQLEVRYVPAIDLDASALSAVEAHLFWQHPQRGLMSARDIHAATQEHPELGAALLEFLLEQSCHFVREKVDRRYPSAQLIVPITLEQIVESEPLAAIDRGLTSANLPLDRLKVSIAERHALQDALTSAAFIRNLRSMGIGVHLDDFGMAAAEDLRQLGISSVTVDFAAAGSGDEARTILTDAVEAAQELRLPVTARHARTEAARSLQVSLGCAFEAVGQPLPADTFISAYVEERPATPTLAPGATVSASTPVNATPSSDLDTPGGSATPGEALGPELNDITAAMDAEAPDEIVEKQTRRPAGPLRVSRPPLARPNTEAQSLAAGASQTAPDIDDLAGEPDGLGDESAEVPTEVAGEATSSSDPASGGRPVDAA